MSKSEIKNMAHSVNTRLKNIAVQERVAFEYILLRYAVERFLFRLSVSSHADRFILKGASAFSVWLGPIFRVTRDADLYCSGNSAPEFLLQCFREICGQNVSPDGVTFDIASMQASEIRKEQQYHGTRIAFNAHIDQARVNLQFDIGFGDSVFPAAEFCEYPVLLESPKPKIKVYPRYTVVAEKFEAMVALGMKNSRLKDFFDIWLLAECFNFDFPVLKQAVERTFSRRKTMLPNALPIALTEEFFADAMKLSQWNAFLRKINPAKRPGTLADTAHEIARLLGPIIQPSASEPAEWIAGQGWR